MSVITWVILGLVAGALAKLIMPGDQAGGFIMTIMLGIVGALLGGFLGSALFGWSDLSGFDLRSIAIAVVGALIVLFIYGLATRRRT